MSDYSLSNFNFKVEAGVFSDTLSLKSECDGVYEFLLSLKSDEKITPEPVTVSFNKTITDTFSVWTPTAFQSRAFLFNKTVSRARSASGAPVHEIISKSGNNRFCIALSDAATSTEIKCAVSEFGGFFMFTVTFFTELTDKTDSYSAVIRIDTRDIPYYEALSSVSDFWTDCGYENANVPNAAFDPLYSTWYSFHQKITADDVVNQCALAVKYGMKTVIVDDGWQCENNTLGYRFCGDWKVTPVKIPDMADFVKRIHALGMKFMLWYSVPFIGTEAECANRFRGMYLNADGTGLAHILDPRFKEVRDYLVGTYKSALIDFDLDGFKLDFIDSFKLSDASSTDFDKMDCVSLEEAVGKLLSEITSTLKEIKPDILIEFRQGYIGPVMRKYGNMMRVSDCPTSALTNRVSSIDLRLISGKAAIHSDMVLWNKNETPEAAANQLINLLFAVPQISVKLDEITDEQRSMLEFYLNFAIKHQKTLLGGKLIPRRPEVSYSSVTAESENEAVTALYSENFLNLSDKKSEYAVNGTGVGEIFVETDSPRFYTVFDCSGHITDAGTLLAGVQKLSVPLSGIVEFIS